MFELGETPVGRSCGAAADVIWAERDTPVDKECCGWRSRRLLADPGARQGHRRRHRRFRLPQVGPGPGRHSSAARPESLLEIIRPARRSCRTQAQRRADAQIQRESRSPHSRRRRRYGTAGVVTIEDIPSGRSSVRSPTSTFQGPRGRQAPDGSVQIATRLPVEGPAGAVRRPLPRHPAGGRPARALESADDHDAVGDLLANGSGRSRPACDRRPRRPAAAAGCCRFRL
ncbi:hypothetical protein HBB16_12780 [Pseudonocardia sp. MCCB 268]|nr:hypothetical protein [Pseudonocardia cytotoxica]